MKKQLAVLATIALCGVFANAADDKGTEFKFGGEVLQRYQTTQGANLQSGSSASATSDFLSRNQFHVNAISSDKLQAYFDFIHTAVWGSANSMPTNTYPYQTNGPSAGPNGGTAGSTAVGVTNAVQINEAWLWWKVSDMFSVRSGRQGMNYGDGLVFSRNEWLATPYAADSAMGRLSWDFLDLDVGGGSLANVGSATGSQTEAEIVFYGAYASLKTLPDFFKKAEIFILQTNLDAGLGASSFVPNYTVGGGSMGLTSVGLHLKGDVSLIDWRLDGVYQTGQQKANGAVTGVTYNANMIDAAVGANFPEFMKARVFVNFHRDTGSDSADPTQQHAYQPLFYDRHAYGSELNAIGWGNLTNIRLGVDVSPMEDTTFGLHVDMLSRTSTTQNTNGTSAGTNWMQANEGNLFGGTQQANGLFGPTAAVNGSNSALGTEFALVANHNYGHGFSMDGTIGYWSVGNYFQNTGSPFQFLANAKYQF